MDREEAAVAFLGRTWLEIEAAATRIIDDAETAVERWAWVRSDGWWRDLDDPILEQ